MRTEIETEELRERRDPPGRHKELGVREDDVMGPLHGQEVHPLRWARALEVLHELIGSLLYELSYVASGPR